MEDPTTSDLTRLSLHELIERLATGEPIPGGGSASAAAGAMGAALVSMVVELTTGRPDATNHAAELADVAHASAAARGRLVGLFDEDAGAYLRVVHARRLPRTTDQERDVRRAEMSRAMHDAAEAPLHIARASCEVLRLAERIAPIGNPNAVSDVGVAALLAAAAVRGAGLNVRINIPYLADDDPLRAEAPGEIDTLEARAGELERAIQAEVGRRMSPS